MAKAKTTKSSKSNTTRPTRNSTPATDRRKATERRNAPDRRKADFPVADERRSYPERRQQPRRRQIDPTTCERDYSSAEIEFMHAMDEYKRNNGRMFPTCSEILEVVRSLGYEKRSQESTPLLPDSGAAPADDTSLRMSS